MADNDAQSPPFHGPVQEALSVFLGEWRAEGTSFGGTDQSGPARANGIPWVSTHSTRWHSGEFFLVQDEHAELAGKPFDTLSVFGVEPGGALIDWTFDNNGFYRHYTLAVEGRTWLLTGETERATTLFSADGNAQTISWEWLRDGAWLPLCDRIASRIGKGD